MVTVGSFITRRSSLSMFLVLAIFIISSVQAADFTWRDCGVQLTKDIHYESAAISVSATGRLSINVKATVVNLIYGADTWVTVFRDGEIFLNVKIQNLCDIVSTTNALSCPLQPGPISFTYTFNEVPPMPKGRYEFQIKSYINYIGPQVNFVEVGCISLSNTVGGLGIKNTTFTSSFTVTVAGTTSFQLSDYKQRTYGHQLNIGTSGKYGQFISTLKGTDDIGGSVDVSGFEWSLSGTLGSITYNGTNVYHGYSGTFTVYASDDDSVFAEGAFNFTNVIDTTGAQGDTLTGTLALNPAYIYDSSRFTYPIVIGNLAPFQITRLPDGVTFVVTGSRTWCTAGLDACGVCGGNGTSCGLGTVDTSDNIVKNPVVSTEWSDKKKAAVAIGVGGGVIGIVAITILVLMVRKARRMPYYDDEDLIDHPQKPDYGTMAIDDMLREGERAPY